MTIRRWPLCRFRGPARHLQHTETSQCGQPLRAAVRAFDAAMLFAASLQKCVARSIKNSCRLSCPSLIVEQLRVVHGLAALPDPKQPVQRQRPCAAAHQVQQQAGPGQVRWPGIRVDEELNHQRHA